MFHNLSCVAQIYNQEKNIKYSLRQIQRNFYGGTSLFCVIFIAFVNFLQFIVFLKSRTSVEIFPFKISKVTLFISTLNYT